MITIESFTVIEQDIIVSVSTINSLVKVYYNVRCLSATSLGTIKSDNEDANYSGRKRSLYSEKRWF